MKGNGQKIMKREVPNTNKARKNHGGNIYAMDFGHYDDDTLIIKLGQSVDTAKRASQHKSKGNKYIVGREPKILMNCGVSVYSQSRYEDKNREIWDNTPGFTRCPGCKDTFFVDTRIVSEISLIIRKTYTVAIA